MTTCIHESNHELTKYCHLSQSRLVITFCATWSILIVDGTHRTVNDFVCIASSIWSCFNARIFWLYIWFEDMITRMNTTNATMRVIWRIVFSMIFETRNKKHWNRLCCLYVKRVVYVLHSHVRSCRLIEDALSFGFFHHVYFFDLRYCDKLVLNVRLYSIESFSIYKKFFVSCKFTARGSPMSATCSNKQEEFMCSDCLHYQSLTGDKILICSDFSSERNRSIRCCTP